MLNYLSAALLFFSAIGAAADLPPARASQKMHQNAGTWHFQTSDKGLKDREGQYLEYTPADWDGTSALPLLIFLHGAGIRGTDITKVYADEVPAQIRAGRVVEAIVLCPQVSSYWSGTQAAAFIDQALTHYAGRFDPDRVYLTGESSGGGGTWEGAKLRSGKLAAAVPIASALGRPEGAQQLVNLPVWAFHNRHDPYQSVEKTRTQVAAVKEAGGRYIIYTEYTQTPGKMIKGIYPACHAQAWQAAYSDPAMWEWLFKQRRGKPELALTTQPSTRGSAATSPAPAE